MGNEGIDGAPWWARWISGIVAQAGLAWAQWLLFQRPDVGAWPMVAVAGCQSIVGVAMVFGPGQAARLAIGVGEALKAAKASRAPKSQKPQEQPTQPPSTLP